MATHQSGCNSFQFAGAYEDSGTNLYQMKARFYQPATGRFTQLDPLKKNLLTGNRYQYASCNPTNRVDPSGLISVESRVRQCLSEGFWDSYLGGLGGFITGLIWGALTGPFDPAVAAAGGLIGGWINGCLHGLYDR